MLKEMSYSSDQFDDYIKGLEESGDIGCNFLFRIIPVVLMATLLLLVNDQRNPIINHLLNSFRRTKPKNHLSENCAEFFVRKTFSYLKARRNANAIYQ